MGFGRVRSPSTPRASQGRAAAEPVPEKPAVWGQVANAVVYGVPSTLKNCVVRLWWGESAVCSLESVVKNRMDMRKNGTLSHLTSDSRTRETNVSLTGVRPGGRAAAFAFMLSWYNGARLGLFCSMVVSPAAVARDERVELRGALLRVGK